MITKVESQQKIDLALWFVAIAVLTFGVIGTRILGIESLLVRVFILIITAAVGMLMLSKTGYGKKLLRIWQEAVLEVRKMVWPTKAEITQTTLAVLAMVIVMGIFVWATDYLLLAAIKWLMSHKGVS